MKNSSTEIYFYYPTAKNVSTEQLSLDILKNIKKEGTDNFLGYRSLKGFKQTLNYYFGSKKVKQIEFAEKHRKKIIDIILEMQGKFERELKFKYKPIRYFIFPWFPNKKVSKEFGGLTAMAPYFGTVHLYLESKNFSEKALKETLAHELNHLYFFEIKNKFLLNVKESIVLEGLAENFREHLVGGKVAPWAKYLSVSENIKAINKLKDKYDLPYAKNTEVFFGGGGFKKWTGYSLGYFLVKKYLKNNKSKKWTEIMNTSLDIFFK